MATQRAKQRARTHPVVYQGKALRARCLSLGLLALMLAGDGMPIKHPICYERQAWEINSKLVVESGLIWEVDE